MTDSDSTFYQLPAVMPLPHRPQDGEDVLRWAKEIHRSIYDNYIPQTDRIENMIMVGKTMEERPEPIGSRRFFYYRPGGDEEDTALYLDVRYGGDNYWELISFAEEAEGIASQRASLGTGDDHNHLIIEVADEEPANEDLENGQAIFWYLESLEV